MELAGLVRWMQVKLAHTKCHNSPNSAAEGQSPCMLEGDPRRAGHACPWHASKPWHADNGKAVEAVQQGLPILCQCQLHLTTLDYRMRRLTWGGDGCFGAASGLPCWRECTPPRVCGQHPRQALPGAPHLRMMRR
jgi:hypothetical protein